VLPCHTHREPRGQAASHVPAAAGTLAVDSLIHTGSHANTRLCWGGAHALIKRINIIFTSCVARMRALAACAASRRRLPMRGRVRLQQAHTARGARERRPVLVLRQPRDQVRIRLRMRGCAQLHLVRQALRASRAQGCVRLAFSLPWSVHQIQVQSHTAQPCGPATRALLYKTNFLLLCSDEYQARVGRHGTGQASRGGAPGGRAMSVSMRSTCSVSLRASVASTTCRSAATSA